MGKSRSDEVDRAILAVLQADARRNTNAEVSERVGVSPSTVGKRIRRMERAGLISGYRTEVDYEAVGFSLRVLFVCTAPIAEREALSRAALEVSGVVHVRELMAGQENVHVEAACVSTDDVTRVARELDELGCTVTDEILIRSNHFRPADFGAITYEE